MSDASFHQRTLEKPVATRGVGLHSGAQVTLTLAAGAGGPRHRLPPGGPARLAAASRRTAPFVVDTALATTLGKGEARVGTVEHLLAALSGLGIDNVRRRGGRARGARSSTAAPPRSSTSSARRASASSRRRSPSWSSAARWCSGTATARRRSRPATGCGSTAPSTSTTRWCPGSRSSIDFSSDSFTRELARARTFGFLKDVERMKSAGLARGGSLENAIVVDEFSILNPEGLRYPGRVRAAQDPRRARRPGAVRPSGHRTPPGEEERARAAPPAGEPGAGRRLVLRHRPCAAARAGAAGRCGFPTSRWRSSHSEAPESPALRRRGRPLTPWFAGLPACAAMSIAGKVRLPMNVSRSLAPAAIAAFALACACSKQATTASSACRREPPPDRVVATYNGGKITAGELEKEARPQIADLENKMYQAKRTGPRADGDGAHRQGRGGEGRALRPGLHPKAHRRGAGPAAHRGAGAAVLRPAEERRADSPRRDLRVAEGPHRPGAGQPAAAGPDAEGGRRAPEAGQPQDRPAAAADLRWPPRARRADRRTRR